MRWKEDQTGDLICKRFEGYQKRGLTVDGREIEERLIEDTVKKRQKEDLTRDGKEIEGRFDLRWKGDEKDI